MTDYTQEPLVFDIPTGIKYTFDVSEEGHLTIQFIGSNFLLTTLILPPILLNDFSMLEDKPRSNTLWLKSLAYFLNLRANKLDEEQELKNKEVTV